MQTVVAASRAGTNEVSSGLDKKKRNRRQQSGCRPKKHSSIRLYLSCGFTTERFSLAWIAFPNMQE